MGTGQTLARIQREERQRTAENLASTLPAECRGHARALSAAIVEAVNNYVGGVDEYLDARLLPAMFRAMADEHERITSRLRAEGLE